MSRTAVRQAIADYLTGISIAGVNRVYAAQPVKLDGFYGTAPGSTSGAVLTVHIASETEARSAIGGPYDGLKRVDYTVLLDIDYVAVTLAATGADEGVNAAGDLDAIVDAVKGAIRADRQAGTGWNGAVWQWGEAQMIARYGVLVPVGDSTVHLWAQIQTEATEFIHT